MQLSDVVFHMEISVQAGIIEPQKQNKTKLVGVRRRYPTLSFVSIELETPLLQLPHYGYSTGSSWHGSKRLVVASLRLSLSLPSTLAIRLFT